MLQGIIYEDLAPGLGLLGKVVVKRSENRTTVPKKDTVSSKDARASKDVGVEVSSPEVDRALVERARNGDLDSYRQLVEKYQSRAHSIAVGVIGNREDAEDIVQDAFLKAYRNLSSFRGQSSFYTWFYRIVFNLAIDLSRKRYRRSETNLGDDGSLDALNLHSAEDTGNLLGHVPNPDQVLERQNIAANIRRALDSLSAEHRAVILLREVEGLSYSEISDVVGCSKGTVMSRLHHARKRLQRTLAEFLPWRSSTGEQNAYEDSEESADQLKR